MKSERSFLPFAAVALFAVLASAPARADVLSFKAWKQQRVDEAKVAILRLQADAALEGATTIERGARAGAAPRNEKRLEQARVTLEIAQELTANDYFVLYLKPFKSKDAFLEAARKLSPDEMGELMVAYQKQLASESGDVGAPANAPATSSASATSTERSVSGEATTPTAR